MLPQILVLILLVLLSAVFSGSETALVSITSSKVNELVAQKVRHSSVLKKLKRNPHRLLITILIGNNVVNIGASVYAAVIFTKAFDSSGIGIATGVMTFLILVFGEITPKSFAHQHAVGVSLLVARLIYSLQIILFPLVWVFEKIVNFVNRLVGSKKGTTVTEGEIVAMLSIGAAEGTIEKQEKELIENVLEFNDIEVEEVMMPRVHIEALDSNMNLQDAVSFVLRHTHTRLPVYNGDLDNIIGIISIKELLGFYDKYPPNKKLSKLKLTPPLEIPLSKKINKLFSEFQRKHQHMALVIDDHGGTAGLVTMEDLLEEIVGEIVDEFDAAEKPIEIVNRTTVLARGSALVEDINDFFRIKLFGNERNSISTMITDYLHRFPLEGETVIMPRIKIDILKMNRHLVSKVRIQKRRKIPAKKS
ncbi:MAG: hemolysin family protein [Candidatus Peregrinibacteria bacterium]